MSISFLFSFAFCFSSFLSYLGFFFLFFFFKLKANYFTILWWFCHTFTWISHGCTCVPILTLPPTSPPPISQGHPSAPALSTLSHASNLDWRSVSHMLIYMFQCYSLKSSHPSQLFVRPPPTTILPFCISFSWEWFWSLPPVQCYETPFIVLQELYQI